MALSIAAPAPAQNQTGSIINFLLGMSTLQERKKSREVSERMTDIRAGELALSEKGQPSLIDYRLSMSGQLDATTKRMRLETEEEFSKTNMLLKQRVAALKTYGTKVGIAEAKRELSRGKELFEIWGKKSDEVKFNIGFADELYKSSQREVQGLAAENRATRAQLDQAKFNMEALDQKFKFQAPFLEDAAKVSTTNPILGSSMKQAVMTGDMQSYFGMAAKASEDIKVAKDVEAKRPLALKTTQPFVDITDPEQVGDEGPFGKDIALGPDTGMRWKGLVVSGAPNEAIPELRRFPIPAGMKRWYWPDKRYAALDKSEATGFGLDWDTGTVISPAGTPADTPGTTQPSIRDAAREAVKKVTPAKKSTPKTHTKMVNPKGAVFQVLKKDVQKRLGKGWKVQKGDQENITDSRGWIEFISPDGAKTWVNPKDRELALSRGYKLSTK